MHFMEESIGQIGDIPSKEMIKWSTIIILHFIDWRFQYQ